MLNYFCKEHLASLRGWLLTADACGRFDSIHILAETQPDADDLLPWYGCSTSCASVEATASYYCSNSTVWFESKLARLLEKIKVGYPGCFMLSWNPSLDFPCILVALLVVMDTTHELSPRLVGVSKLLVGTVSAVATK